MRIRHIDDFTAYEVAEELDFAGVDDDAGMIEYVPADPLCWEVDDVSARAIADAMLEELI